MSCSDLLAQPKELTNISMAQKYFSEHVLELDPIEGIYDVENIVEVGASGYGAQTIKQNLTWIILDVNKIDYGNERGFHSDYDFLVYSVSGRPTGLMGGINKLSTPFYTLHSVNANGGEKKITFSLENGVMFKSSDRTYRGNAVSVTNMIAIKSFPTFQMYQDAIYAEAQRKAEVSKPTTWTGTGFALTNNYIVTNFHVVDNAKNISVQGINGDFNSHYQATVVGIDKHNDLAMLKVNGVTISSNSIPYAVKTTTSEVGEDIFVLGYPLTSTMGDEIKLTTGVVSSKTGFQGDVALYQISAPIQPGNSGGPLFDSKGNVIGVVSAKHTGAENVGYAIKASYLRNLMESSLSSNILPQTNKISALNLSGKVKAVKNYVYYITCSSSKDGSLSTSPSSNSGGNSSARTFNYPSVTRNAANSLKVISVTLENSYTKVVLSDNNRLPNGGYYQWFTLDKNTYIVANGNRYTLTKAEGITISPEKTYFSYAGETKTFSLYFPAIPPNTTSIDLIESATSEWRLYGIQLR